MIDQLCSMSANQRSLDQGSYLFHQGDPVRTVFVVMQGSIELTRHQRDGTSIVLQRAGYQMVLAEASVYASAYHCDAVVALPSRVLELKRSIFLRSLREDAEFGALWAQHLALEVQSARYRSELLSRRTVSERLDGWLAWQGVGLPCKGQWKSVALQIGVSPEALYRELAKRRQ